MTESNGNTVKNGRPPTLIVSALLTSASCVSASFRDDSRLLDLACMPERPAFHMCWNEFSLAWLLFAVLQYQ
eukprot:1157646-Pelagomonas_calceolata.AAC.4